MLLYFLSGMQYAEIFTKLITNNELCRCTVFHQHFSFQWNYFTIKVTALLKCIFCVKYSTFAFLWQKIGRMNWCQYGESKQNEQIRLRFFLLAIQWNRLAQWLEIEIPSSFILNYVRSKNRNIPFSFKHKSNTRKKIFTIDLHIRKKKLKCFCDTICVLFTVDLFNRFLPEKKVK